MKLNLLYVLSIMVTSLACSMPLLADEAQPNVADSTSGSSIKEGCSLDATLSPKRITEGNVSYVSGGICINGVNQMKRMAKDFPLEVVLVQKSAEYEKENYIADVRIHIKDAQDNLVLEVVTEGPFLLVDLPSGSYQMTADFRHDIKSRNIKINRSKHQRIVFLWPADASSDPL
jgi:hypothetical protein